VAPAAAILRRLVDRSLTVPGATACVGLLTKDQILAELAHLPMRTEATETWPDHPAFLRRIMGSAFDRLPPQVQVVHAGEVPAVVRGWGRARGALSPIPRLGRAVLGLPEPGLYRDLTVKIVPQGDGELWTRAFGTRSFSSRIRSLPAPGRFEERFGLLRFTFDPQLTPSGFRWRLRGWRLGLLPMPRALAPRTRATTFARDGVYRFRVLVAHPWLGVIFGYAGRLET
jgi:hypothetical protein